MPDRKPIIYLDSADFSTLSEPGITEKLKESRDMIVELSKSNKAIFVFSIAHISEMAPTQQKHAEKANARTEFLASICKRNTMISFDNLIKIELEKLVMQDPVRAVAISNNGSWFPDLSGIIDPLNKLNIAENINNQIKDENLNRNHRRFLNRTLQKKGRIRFDVETKLGKFDVDELLGRYPMRPLNAITLKNYIFGKASKAEAENAFLESLRDPIWLMKWFSEHYDRLGPIGDLVRQPAQNLVSIISEDLIPMVEHLHQGSEIEKREIKKLLSKTYWLQSQDSFLLNIVNRLAIQLFPNTNKCNNIELVDRYCPGLSTCIRVIHNSLRNSLTENPRKIKNSDIVDAFHSLYIPYVSHFRTDNYMSGLMKPLAEKHGTTIITDLTKIGIEH